MLYENVRIFESEERETEEFLEFIENLIMRKGVAFEIIMEISLSIPLAKVFKKVYAVIKNFSIAEVLSKKLRELKITNVGVIVAERPPEVEFPIDLVILSNLQPLELLREYLCWAKKANFVIIAEWKEKEFSPLFENILKEISRDFEILGVKNLSFCRFALLKARNGK
ncbi:MAG: hypothetical protein QXN34_03425 [Archaeoglobaceae archaeon]